MLKQIILIGQGIAIGVLCTLIFQEVTTDEAPEQIYIELAECPVDWNKPEPVVTYTEGCTHAHPEKFDKLLEQAAAEFDVNPRVLAVTAWRESGCSAAAIGGSGEIGLMQIHPGVWGPTLAAVGMVDLADPRTNLRAGALILADLRGRSATPQVAVRRYNGSGPKARRYAADQMATYFEAWGEQLEI